MYCHCYYDFLPNAKWRHLALFVALYDFSTIKGLLYNLVSYEKCSYSWKLKAWLVIRLLHASLFEFPTWSITALATYLNMNSAMLRPLSGLLEFRVATGLTSNFH